MEKLTKAEEPVMHMIWKLKKAFVKEIIAELPEPKPPYNTISSIVRILEEKGLVKHVSFGKTHQYMPAISKASYRKMLMRSIIEVYFDGSYKSLVSQITEDEKLSSEDAEELQAIIKNKVKPS